MKFSIQSYTMSLGEWGKNYNIEELCKWTKNNGFDAIDWYTTYGTDVLLVKKIMDDYGLKTSCYTFNSDLNFSDINDAKEEIDNFKKSIDIACELGTNIVMLPVGEKENVDDKTARVQYCSNLNKIISYANDRNIFVTFENFTHLNSPFVTSSDMIEAKKLCSDFYVCFDSGNMLAKNEIPSESFLNNKDIVKFMHFKDFKKSDCDVLCKDGTYMTPCLIGEGLVDYEKLVPLVNKYYDGYINIEYQANDLTPEDAVLKAASYLRTLE